MSQQPAERAVGPRSARQRWLAAAWIAALALLIGWPGRGPERPLDAHESFVARTALEMQRRGDWIVPHFNGQARLQKPPLSYWLTLAAERVTPHGNAEPNSFAAASTTAPPRAIGEPSARLPSVVLGALCAASTAWLGWLLFDSLLVGIWGALFFLTCDLYVEWSRSAQPEMAYACACTLLLVGVAWARRLALEQHSTWRAALLAWSAVALAIYAKGPIFPVLLCSGAAFALRRRAGGPGFLRTLHAGTGLLLVLVLVVPYFALVVRREPGALEFWRAQMFDRVGGVEQAWWRPLEGYYVGQALENAWPWSVLLLLAPLHAWRQRRRARAAALAVTATATASATADANSKATSTSSSTATPAPAGGLGLLAWCALLPLVVLSFSAGRKGYYLLPLTPLLCLWMARTAVELHERARAGGAAARWFAVLLRVHGCAVLGWAVFLIVRARLRAAALELPAAAWFWPAALCVLASAFAFASLWASARRTRFSALVLCAGAILAALATGIAGLDVSDSRFTGGAFARTVARTIDATRPLLVLDGDLQVLVYSTDLPVAALAPEQAAAIPTLVPAPWIVDTAAQWAARKLPGTIVVREASSSRKDPFVLVDARAKLGL